MNKKLRRQIKKRNKRMKNKKGMSRVKNKRKKIAWLKNFEKEFNKNFHKDMKEIFD